MNLNSKEMTRIIKLLDIDNDFDEYEEDPDTNRHLVQWTSAEGKIFIPSTYSVESIPPGLYEIRNGVNIGTYFEAIPFVTEGLLRFPETSSDKVVSEIEDFWSKEKLFKKFGLTYKRGILLYGPAGSGKTCTIKMIMADLISRGGVVIKFTNPELFTDGIRKFREIEPNTPCIVLMEDIDSIVEFNSESQVVNILDGVDIIEKIVFLATTNFPEKLTERILNRPSRFDKRFKIDMPNPESRRIYIKHLFKNNKIKSTPKRKKQVEDKWVHDTEGLSIAHIKELFVSVLIMGYDYDEGLIMLKSMKEDISSESDNNKMGL